MPAEYQSAFHFCGTHSMTRHIDYIIYTAQDSVITIVISLDTIAGKVHAFVGVEIGLPAPFVVAIGGSDHAGPGEFDTEIALHRISRKFFTFRINYHQLHTR